MYYYSLFTLLAALLSFHIHINLMNPYGEREASKILFSYFMLSVGIWNLFEFFLINIPGDMPGIALIFARLSLILLTISVLLCLLFTINLFVDKADRRFMVLAIPAFVVISFILSLDVSAHYHSSTGWSLPIGDLHDPVLAIGTIYVFVYYSIIVVLLSYVVWKTEVPSFRKRILLIYFGILSIGFLGIPFYFLRANNPTLPPAGGFLAFLGSILFYLGLKGPVVRPGRKG